MRFKFKRFIPKKKTIINWVFILPFITCVATSIGIREFVNHQKLRYPQVIEENVTSMVTTYTNFIITLPNKEYTQDRVYNITKIIDSQEGVSAVLYEQNGKEKLYQFNENKSGNELDPEFFDKHIDFTQLHTKKPYFIGKYPETFDGQRIYYLTYRDYTVLWTIRPDFVAAYFVDFENHVLLVITIVLLLNAISAFIALISYYCLKNRISAFVAKHNCAL